MKNSYTAIGRVARVGRPGPSLFICRLLLALLLALPGLAQAQTPAVSSFSPTSGPMGTTISLTGTDLTGATAITFSGSSGNVVSTGYTIASATSITGIVVPSGAITGPITVTTPGGTSPASPTSFTVCALPVAIAQNVSMTLDASGSATVTAAQVNNGSTANCGAGPTSLSLQAAVTGTVSGDVTENGTLTLTAPAGALFTAINFASYGTPTGTAGSYAIGSCHSSISSSEVGKVLLGKNTGNIQAANRIFTDPCNGVIKRLAVTATYTSAPATLTYTCANVGSNPVTLTVTDNAGNTSSTPATVTVSVPPTPTTTWNGSSSTVWTSCANWSYGKVPDAATSVIIPAGQTRYPVLVAGTYPVLNLTINSGGSLTEGTGATLQLNGNFTNSGTATLNNGLVAFVGSAAVQTVSNGTGFVAITVNKASGTVQLARNLLINSTLTLTSGTLTTGSQQVSLAPAATISESETSYVIGKVALTRPLAAGTAESFNGLGLTLTPAAGSSAPGSTVVTRNTGTALTGAGTSQSILRNFDIVPAVNTGLNVTLAFNYFLHELNSIPEAKLAMFKSVSGGTPWIPQSGTTAGPNTVTKTGITDFSRWTLGTTANPLPVELATFMVTAEGPASVRLAWATASEKNSAAFEVERSTDGTGFARLGTVPAVGTSTSPRSYGFVDAKLPGVAQLYYRLRQVDTDGSSSYSSVQVVTRPGAAAGLALYPNPATTHTTLTGALPGALVTVYDALGRPVVSALADATGKASLALPAALPMGVYLLRNGSQALRLTVE